MSDSSEPWLDTVNIVSTLSEFGNCSALTRFPLCTIQYLLCICIVPPVPERLRTNTHTVTAPGVLQDYLFLTGLLAYFSVEATVLTEVVLHLVFKLNSEITYTHQVQIMYVTKHRLTKFVFNYMREPMFTQWYLNLYLRTSVTQHIHWVRRGTENLGGMFLFHFTIIATAGVSNSRFLGFLGIFF